MRRLLQESCAVYDPCLAGRCRPAMGPSAVSPRRLSGERSALPAVDPTASRPRSPRAMRVIARAGSVTVAREAMPASRPGRRRSSRRGAGAALDAPRSVRWRDARPPDAPGPGRGDPVPCLVVTALPTGGSRLRGRQPALPGSGGGLRGGLRPRHRGRRPGVSAGLPDELPDRPRSVPQSGDGARVPGDAYTVVVSPRGDIARRFVGPVTDTDLVGTIERLRSRR
jgi:hypothetical protein